jgi:ABC-type transporter Mla maintaining outer membrane lipid asymmetry ATPase subunit MlaF
MSLIEVRDVSKSYGGLRPFRLQALLVNAGEIVAVDGLDRPAAAVLTDLITGTTLPDTGSVVIDGRPTSALGSQDEWLAFLDRFGIVNDRVVLLDELTVGANLAVPLTLELDPMPAEIRRRVQTLGSDVGLATAILDAPLNRASALSRMLVRLGRAIALEPAILLVEHPTADLTAADAMTFARVLHRVATRHGFTVILATGDGRIPRETVTRRLEWRAAAGDVRESAGWRRMFS